MSNRIVFNIYMSSTSEELSNPIYSNILITELTATAVMDYIGFNEGFEAHIIEGITLSFIDFICITVTPQQVMAQLKQLPVTEEMPLAVLPDKCMITFRSEYNDEPLIRNNNELVYICHRYECGASGFTEIVIQWVTEHPVEMIFIGGWIWDRTKDIWQFFRRKANREVQSDRTSAIIFRPKKFHKKLASLMNIDPFYFQITGITQAEQGKHTIDVRTIRNEEYTVIAKSNGDILSIEKKKG